jgi:hypothetical protein
LPLQQITLCKRLPGSGSPEHNRAWVRHLPRSSALSVADARWTAAIFSGRFIRFHFRMSSLLRPQLTQRSPLKWHWEVQGFLISLATRLPLRRMADGQAASPVSALLETALFL